MVFMAESNVEIKNVIICFILLSIIYFVGLALQIRIIIISIQDRDMMWKINTSHSIIMTIYYAVQIIIQTVTHIVPNLSKYSGSWFCTFLLFSNLYGMVSIVGHSLFTAAHKYVFVINYHCVCNIFMWYYYDYETLAFWRNFSISQITHI